MTNKQYEQAVAWLFKQAPNYQIDGKKAYKPGLQNITSLCEFFGNPQQKIRMVHIGGTNGKGSTSNMLSSILQEAGFRVGLYNSPHLVDFTERIKVNGKQADREFVYEFIQRLKELPNTIRPSFFEFTTIMAFEYFLQQKVDIAIIEVGLGGRLDSTNIIQPLACAITNVALDHMNILGDTKEEIALEKAGIIKMGVPVIIGEEDPVIKEIFRQVAHEKDADLIDATSTTASNVCDLKGDYQLKNMRVALELLRSLADDGFEVSEKNITDGLLNVQKNTGFIGRWTVLSDSPLIICDTAHNHAGLELVFCQLENLKIPMHIVLGFVKGKEIEPVLEILPKNAEYYFVKPEIRRGRPPLEYEELLKKAGIKYTVYDDVMSGFKKAESAVQPGEMIFVGGSNFVVGDFLSSYNMVEEIKQAMSYLASDEKREFFPRFFKAGKGEYAEGDEFIGVTVPDQRKIAREYYPKISLENLQKLLSSGIHEHRHLALLMLVSKYEKCKTDLEKQEIVNFYLNNLQHINNWDLVDNSCYKILGRYCFDFSNDQILKSLAESDNLWHKRIAVVATMYHVKKGKFGLTKDLVLKNLKHPHDLMHKANGWLLREIGQQNREELLRFLDKHYQQMPRTTLRYAIEKLEEPLRQDYLKGRI